MGNTTIITTLLASFLLVGGCNSSRPEQQATVNQHMIKRPHVNINDSIERRTVPDDSLPPLPDIEDETFAPRTLIISYDTETGTAALDEAIKDYGADSSVPASESSFVGTVSYEEAMQPHVNYVKKSSANLKQYYAVACSVVSGFGKRRGLRL